MRTTVALDPDTAALVRRQMHERGVTFKQALNDLIRAGSRAAAESVPPFSTEPAALGVPTVNLDHALRFAGEIEDEELLRKAFGRVRRCPDEG